MSRQRRTLSGTVVGAAMDKTIRVQVVRRVKHPMYGKYMTRSTRIMAHDQDNSCKPGDRVTVAETRPISRHKSWTLLQIDEHSEETQK